MSKTKDAVTESTNMSDPYEMLRSARDIIRKNMGPGWLTWVHEYKKLAGARLTHKEVRVLRDPHRRMRGMNQDIVAKLLMGGYLQEVWTHAGKHQQWRISRKGREALRLREDVVR